MYTFLLLSVVSLLWIGIASVDTTDAFTAIGSFDRSSSSSSSRSSSSVEKKTFSSSSSTTNLSLLDSKRWKKRTDLLSSSRSEISLSSKLYAGAGGGEEPSISVRRIADDDEMSGTPIPFLDKPNNRFIECYPDIVATFQQDTGENNMEYTIAVPCDYCVALCYTGDDGNLIPVELEDELMDDVYLVAENIVSEEFGEELVLQRTPQTLTLVGELEEDDEDDEDDDDDDDDDDDEEYTGEEEVELLLSFEHRDKEFSLVRLVEPVLIVGKADPERPDIRNLLTPEESEWVMPLLERAFLQFHEDEEEEDD